MKDQQFNMDTIELIATAEAAHQAWLQRLIRATTLGAGNAEQLRDLAADRPDGPLKPDDIGDNTRRSEPYHLARWLHGEVRTLAAQSAELARGGENPAESARLGRECIAMSNVLSHVLAQWKVQLEGRCQTRLFGS